MGTDKFEFHNGPCACGKGRYLAYDCSPDHPYPSKSRWKEFKITCNHCEKRYTLGYASGRVVQFHNTDLAKRKRAREKYWRQYVTAEKAVMQRAEPHLEALEAILSSQRSMAAAWRCLTGVGFYVGTVQTFRKHYHGAGDWIKHNVTIRDLKRVLDLLSREDPELLLEVDEALEIYRKRDAVPRPEGRAVPKHARPPAR